MDDQLVKRFREGDVAAQAAVRNQLRAMATRVLSSPQWQLDAAGRQVLEREAAALAMQSGADSAVALTVTAMGAAATRGIGWLRKRDGLREDGHPDARLIVGVALQTASANQKLHIEKHFEECPTCKQHFTIVQEALRGATKARAAAQQAAPAPAPQPNGQQDLADFARQRAARQKQERARTKKPSPRRRPRKKKAQSAPKAWPLAVGAVLLAAGVWWQAQPSEQQKLWHMQTLMPDELPPLGRAQLYDTRTERSIEDAANGECRQAGNKLRSAAASDPDDYWLSYYEGMAWVCDGDGERALEAFAKVDAATTDVPWGFTWWYGQALLLDLRVDEGLQVLDSLGASNHPRSDDARQLAARVRNAY